MRYYHTRGQWFVWAGHHWVGDVDGLVYRLAIETARRRYADGAFIADLAERQREAKFAIDSENRERLEATLALARQAADHPRRRRLGPRSWRLAVANGVIDLEDGELRPGRPEELINRTSPVRYEAAAGCPRWQQFLPEVFRGDAELIDWIWRFCGYLLTGLTSEQCFLLLYGLGANGKSTFLNVSAGAAWQLRLQRSLRDLRGQRQADPQRLGRDGRPSPGDLLGDRRTPP